MSEKNSTLLLPFPDTRGAFHLFILLLGIISLALHYPAFRLEPQGIHAWRQTQTLSTVVNFMEEDMNILHPRRNSRGDGEGIFRMEFPLMQWLCAAIAKVTGQPVFISRLFSFILGWLSILALGKLVIRLTGNFQLGAAAAWAMNFSPAFYYYTVSPLPDNFALCCSLWGIFLFLNGWEEKNLLQLVLAGLFLSLGAASKLPYILFLIVPFSWFWLHRNEKNASRMFPLILPFILIPTAWYAWVIPGWKGNGVVSGMLGQPPGAGEIAEIIKAHILSIWPELLLNYAALPLLLAGVIFFFRNQSFSDKKFLPFLLCLGGFFAYAAFELNMIGTVHDYYLLPFLPFLFLGVAYGIRQLLQSSHRGMKILVMVCLALLPLTAMLRIQHRWHPDSPPGFNPDLLTFKEELRSAVPDNALCVAGNDLSTHIFYYYIHKKGWVFDQDLLMADSLKSWINRGAEYLYSDSRAVDTHPTILPLLEKEISSSGSIKIFKLKKENPTTQEGMN